MVSRDPQLDEQKRDAERKSKKAFRGPGGSGDMRAAFDLDHAPSGTLQSETLEWLRDAQEALKRDVSLDVVEDLLLDGEAICAKFGLAVGSRASTALPGSARLDSRCRSAATIPVLQVQHPAAKRRRVEPISEVRSRRKARQTSKSGAD